MNYQSVANDIKQWGRSLGFDQVGITDTELSEAESHLFNWLGAGFHGDMEWMERHGTKRSHPAELIPGTLSVISVRLNYLSQNNQSARRTLRRPEQACISNYALGRDYHKLMRKRLQRLADRIEAGVGSYGYRVFVDSAPVLEKALAEKAGIGWIGKHTNLLNSDSGSWFFLGEIYTDLPLPVDKPAENRCETCTCCIDVCPTQAIVAPYQVDARRCISYLTIELRTSIPEALRPLIGNHIYGCDDCQLVCPWNKYAKLTQEIDFSPRNNLDHAALLDLFKWDEAIFFKKTEGSAIRRIGYECWLRNIAVALGNSSTTPEVVGALQKRAHQPSQLVREHVQWALIKHGIQ
ncbi:MAG: tRNA epoxyqueuosine(34) reductase QueG [Woeseiaceae bacterium]